MFELLGPDTQFLDTVLTVFPELSAYCERLEGDGLLFSVPDAPAAERVTTLRSLLPQTWTYVSVGVSTGATPGFVIIVRAPLPQDLDRN